MNNTMSQSPLSQHQPEQSVETKTNVLAIASLVVAFFAPIVAFVLSLIALHQISKSSERGKGLAIAGLIVSILMLLATIGLFVALVASSFSGVQQKARDTERETDIQSIHAQLEAYYSQHGFYPSLSNLNDGSFRKSNLKGLSESALQTPNFSSSVLLSTPSENGYSYQTTPRDCNNDTEQKCLSYTLIAILESGEIFEKRDLNSSLQVRPN